MNPCHPNCQLRQLRQFKLSQLGHLVPLGTWAI